MADPSARIEPRAGGYGRRNGGAVCRSYAASLGALTSRTRNNVYPDSFPDLILRPAVEVSLQAYVVEACTCFGSVHAERLLACAVSKNGFEESFSSFSSFSGF